MGTRQENFCIEKGYAHDAEVIYGDTDSAPWADGGYIMATLSYQWGGGYIDSRIHGLYT